MPEKEIAIIEIKRPVGCEDTKLSVNAMDWNTSRKAWATVVHIEERPLMTESFKLLPNGNMLIEVRPQSFVLGNFESSDALCGSRFGTSIKARKKAASRAK